MTRNANSLLFGPRPLNEPTKKIPDHCFSEARRGNHDFVISYLQSLNSPALRDDCHSLATALSEAVIGQRLKTESLFELTPEQNSPGLDIEIADNPEIAEAEKQHLGSYLLDNLGQPDTTETIFTAPWTSDTIGPLALRLIASYVNQGEDPEEALANLILFLVLAYRDNNPDEHALFAAAHQQATWMVLRESENFARQILLDLKLRSSISPIFASANKIDFSGGDNQIHVLLDNQFLCGAPSAQKTRVLRGSWLAVDRYQDGEQSIYSRCPECAKQAEMVMTPGCEDMAMSLLDWENYNYRLAYISRQLKGIYRDIDKEMESDQEADFYPPNYQVASSLANLMEAVRKRIIVTLIQTIAKEIAAALQDKAEKDSLHFLDNLWQDRHLIDSFKNQTTSPDPPSAQLIEGLLHTIIADLDLSNPEETSQLTRKALGLYLAEHYGISRKN